MQPLRATGLSHAPPNSTDGGSPRSSLKAFSHGPGSSEINTSTSVSRGQGGFDRRLAWLEEDVALLHRRYRDERSDGAGAVASDLSFRTLAARVDEELAEERRSREVLEARVNQLEATIIQERRDRELQLNSFSTELETVMRSLIDRIDMGLSAREVGSSDRTDETEARLRTLIRRVDEGLSAGAAALQHTLNTAGTFVTAEGGASHRARSCNVAHDEDAHDNFIPGCGRQAYMHPNEDHPSSDQLIQSWDRLRQENRQLREHRAHVRARSPVSVGASVVFSSFLGNSIAAGPGRCIVPQQHGFAQGNVGFLKGGLALPVQHVIPSAVGTSASRSR